MLRYATGGRYYQIKKKKKSNGEVFGEVSRISCEEYEKTKGRCQVKPKPGDKVVIIIKPYHEYNCVRGVVKDVLTRSQRHTRGHKVRLQTGDIGRTMTILNCDENNSQRKRSKKRRRSKSQRRKN